MKLLVQFQSAQHNPLSLQEGLDLALACSAMGQEVGLLFMGDSLRIFNSGYDHNAFGGRDLSKNLKALPLYGIDDVWFCEPNHNRPKEASYPDGARWLTPDDIASTLLQYERVISF